MEYFDETISGNTIEPQPEEPETESGDVEDGEENQENVGDGETSGDDGEETGGDDSEETDGGETGNSDGVFDTPTGGESEAPSYGVGGNDSTVDVGTSPDYLKEVLDSISSMGANLFDSPEYSELLESLRDLTDTLSYQIETYSSNPIPISGYRDYDYPITVTFRISPSAPNAPSSMPSTEMFYTPEEFEERYDALCGMVGGSLKSFSIYRIKDCSDLEYVYDADNLPEEPEEEPEEFDAYQADVLEALAALHEDFQIVIENDAAYFEQYTVLQEEFAEVQELNTDLQYHLLASNIAIGFTIILTLGYTVAHGFLQRMKVG